VLAMLFAVFWLRSQGATWFAWWSASLLLGCVTALLFMMQPAVDGHRTVGIGIAFLIAAFACCWQGARAFEGRPPLWVAALAFPVAWLASTTFFGAMESVVVRIVSSSAAIAILLALAGLEFWRGRSEPLPSRWPVIVIFASFCLFMLARIPMIGILPYPFGALPMEPGYLGAFNLIMFAHTILLSVLFVSLSKERLELDQRTKALTDPLTGTLNRRAFIARGERLLARHAYEHAPLSLLFLDLDHFKSLNDRFGHSGGDDVLMSFVDLVNSCIRPTDYLFRIGGEEFCCLLPHTTTVQAHRVAERIRYQFEAAVISVGGTSVKATVSLGIASTQAIGYDLDTLMRRADKAVYAAKRAGRNCVMVAEEAAVVAATA
jgi:diguanylate cyclase (GGDEF)-like protein